MTKISFPTNTIKSLATITSASVVSLISTKYANTAINILCKSAPAPARVALKFASNLAIAAAVSPAIHDAGVQLLQDAIPKNPNNSNEAMENETNETLVTIPVAE